MTLQEYTALKNRVTQLRDRASRADGIHQSNVARLQSEFGVDDTASATALLTSLESEARVKNEEADRLLAEFNKKWEGKV